MWLVWGARIFWVSSWSGLSGRPISFLRRPLASRSTTLQNPYCVTHLGAWSPCGVRAFVPFRRSGGQEVAGSNPASPTGEVLVMNTFCDFLANPPAARGHYCPINEARRSTASRCIPGNTDE
jgi:hypothetical protein